LLNLLKIHKTYYLLQKGIYYQAQKEKKVKNKIFIIALLLIITAVGAWAQNLPAFPSAPGVSTKHTWASSIWTSPQSSTTEGRFRSNADDFIRPDAYTGVKFNKWFGMTSFLWAGEEASSEMIATIGFATKINNIYVGAFYTGNMWEKLKNNDYTEEVPDPTPAGGVADKTYNTYSSINVAAEPGNNFAVLIGAADMGFRLTYRTNYQLFNESDIVTDDQLYKSYQTDIGYLAPQIAWAMAKDLTKNGIRPYAAVDLVFYREYRKTEKAGALVSGEYIEISKNRFDPSLSLGLGGYTFYNQDGFKGSFDVDYVLAFNLYNNEYSYADGGKYKTGKIKGTNNDNGNPLMEEFSMSNLLTPSLSGSWSKDALALKIKLNLPLTLSGKDVNSVGMDSNNKLFYNGQNESTTTFIFRPDIRLAMQYKIIPNRLTLNVGARIQASTLKFETIEQKNYDSDGVFQNKKKLNNTKFGKEDGTSDFNSSFKIGPTLYFTENAWLEVVTGSSATKQFGEGAVKIFDSDGLFSFGNITFVLKF
jgi:hypothetical protein